MKKFFVLFLFFSSYSFAQERLSVIDNNDEIEIKDILELTAKAFSSEDLSLYSSCFQESKRKKVRKETALIFARHQCLMSISDVHVVEIEDNKAEVVANYQISKSSERIDVISKVLLIKEKDKWFIKSEAIQSTEFSKVSIAQNDNKKDWDPYNPDPNKIPESLHSLIGDVGIQEGFGCADGRCRR